MLHLTSCWTGFVHAIAMGFEASQLHLFATLLVKHVPASLLHVGLDRVRFSVRVSVRIAARLRVLPRHMSSPCARM